MIQSPLQQLQWDLKFLEFERNNCDSSVSCLYQGFRIKQQKFVSEYPCWTSTLHCCRHLQSKFIVLSSHVQSYCSNISQQLVGPPFYIVIDIYNQDLELKKKLPCWTSTSLCCRHLQSKFRIKQQNFISKYLVGPPLHILVDIYNQNLESNNKNLYLITLLELHFTLLQTSIIKIQNQQQNSLCCTSQPESNSLLNKISRAAFTPKFRDIVIPAASWLDTNLFGYQHTQKRQGASEIFSQ